MMKKVQESASLVSQPSQQRKSAGFQVVISKGFVRRVSMLVVKAETPGEFQTKEWQRREGFLVVVAVQMYEVLKVIIVQG
jgi:hypothetical protein